MRAKVVSESHFGKKADPEKSTEDIIAILFDEAKLEASKVISREDVLNVWKKFAQKWLDICFTVTRFKLDRNAFYKKVKLSYPLIHDELNWP